MMPLRSHSVAKVFGQQQRCFSTLFRKDAYINGEWVGASSRFDVYDPGNGEKIADLPNLRASDCTKAIDAASAALPIWRAKTGKERSTALRKLYNLHLENLDELGDLLAKESGKPLAEAKGEILYGASYFEWFAEEAKRAYGDIIPSPVKNRQLLAVREPVGVCGLMTPFNFPNAMIARKGAAALAAGCTMVIKPSADTPLSTLAIAVMAEQAGIPKGVINVVTSDHATAPEIGSALTSDDRVKKISFTGSTGVGRILLKQCADTIKKVSMELGGNAPFIVFDDADLDLAVEGFMASKFRNAGQTCVCANRIFVQSGVYDEFAKKIAARLEGSKVGHYTQQDVTIGPLINKKAIEKVSGLVEDALSKDAKAIVGGHDLQSIGALYYAPTVLTDCVPGMRIATEEIFGPVAPLFKFETEEEVIARANDTDVGLASYFFSKDLARCFRVSSALEAGMVGVNTGAISTEVAPFGGVKQSGLGREGSKYGLDDYTEIKYIALQLE